MKSQRVDRAASGHLLESFEDAFVEWLQKFTMPTLVVCGSEDQDNGSAEELANVLPNAIFDEVPGTHMQGAPSFHLENSTWRRRLKPVSTTMS